MLEIYQALNSPDINRNTCWQVYDGLLSRVQTPDSLDKLPKDIDQVWGYHFEENAAFEYMELTDNSRPLAGGPEARRDDGSYYYGGVNRGNGPGRFYTLINIYLS
jgi:hypothetical protein